MKTVTTFKVGESAPGAIEAHSGRLILNELGNIGLQGFMPDPLDPTSKVYLDTSTVPPTLHLVNALTTAHFGYTNGQTGEFFKFDHEMSLGDHIVSGQYAGPGSELELT